MRIKFQISFSIHRDRPASNEPEFDNSPTSGGSVDLTIRDEGRYIGFQRTEEIYDG